MEYGLLHSQERHRVPSPLPDPERQQLVGARGLQNLIPGLIDEIGNIDRSERVGAFGDKLVAGFEPGQRLAHPQRRQWAFEAAQVDGFFRQRFFRQCALAERISSIHDVGMIGQETISDPNAKDSSAVQRIGALTPLAAVEAWIDALVAAVAPHEVAIADAVGRILAEDVRAALRPAVPIALRDGWAVDAAATQDASSYAPAPLSAAVRVDVGAPLPPGTDAVAELDAIEVREDRAQAIAAVTPGEGVLAAGADVNGASPLLGRGCRISAHVAAALTAAGVVHVRVRAPRLSVISPHLAPDPIIAAAMALVMRGIKDTGGTVIEQTNAEPLDKALGRQDVDAIMLIGGTGSGRDDRSVAALARLGRVEAHGIAISPGDTTGFGTIGARPVLLLPGRLDGALAAWLLLGQPLMRRLTASRAVPPAVPARLSRKVTSQLGLAELVPVRFADGAAEPLAARYWPLQSLARADGYFVVAPDHEGYPEGSSVMVRLLP